jgi:DtxR family transcriptional regulator, Mn-dependent transcriptional regulator
MPLSRLSESTEMYLKAIAEVGGDGPVPIARVAERLNITQVSASEMIRRLTEQEFVQHTPYKGVVLTAPGRRHANSVIRRQRLWECFLYDQLKLGWARIYELACDLEHATAPEVTEALAAFLNYPTRCPHGDPIPNAEGECEPIGGMRLSSVPIGAAVRVIAIQATSTNVFEYLEQRGILPGWTVTVLEAAPLQGPLTVRVNDTQVALGLLMADLVVVEVTEK